MKFLEPSNVKVLSRLEETKVQRERSLKAIRNLRPLDAEEDDARKIRRIKAVAKVNDEQAEKLAQYDEATFNALSLGDQYGAETIQGKSVDFINVAFLELARAAATSVGRVVSSSLEPQGTGFMISDNLFITNNHVIQNEEEASDSLVEFEYELGVDNKPKNVTRFKLAPSVFSIFSPVDELDYSIIALGNRVDGKRKRSDLGYCPITDAEDKHALGECGNIVQHPQGGYKEVVLRENQLVARSDDVLHYLSDTQNGSSGSPVFNDQWEVIGLHHWGARKELTDPINGMPFQKDVNEGIRVSAIVRDLKSKRNKLSLEEQQLLDDVLNCSFCQPSLVSAKNQEENGEKYEPRTETDGFTKLTIPLEISIQIPQPVSLKNKEIHEISGYQEASTADPEYEKRNGYNRNFLSNKSVPLPQLNETLKAKAARRLEAKVDEDPYELKYQHFSIVLNAERRMAFYTAVNIDGATWISIDRETGESTEAEAAEVWFEDPRILPEFQCDQSLYHRQLPKRVFDRGHLVRRQDPSWGTKNRAKRANSDTFHFTNCVPQEMNFNERSKYWQGIENYVLDNAKADRERVTVFTGPIFTNDDPEYRYVKVPMHFWKIVARVDNGELRATALLASQSSLIKGLPEGVGEKFVTEYQVPITEIEARTGLSFGSLRNKDTYAPESGESVVAMKKITGFGDVSL